MVQGVTGWFRASRFRLGLLTCMSYEEEEVTCMSYEEEDTCMSYEEEEDTCMSYEEEEDACMSRHGLDQGVTRQCDRAVHL